MNEKNILFFMKIYSLLLHPHKVVNKRLADREENIDKQNSLNSVGPVTFFWPLANTFFPPITHQMQGNIFGSKIFYITVMESKISLPNTEVQFMSSYLKISNIYKYLLISHLYF